jgi:hypothetical protein
MNVRIKFPQGQFVSRHRSKQREVVAAASSLITPTCVMAYVLAAWRLAADMGISGGSGMKGLFSHWQLWMALGLCLQFGGRTLNRRLAALARVGQATR